jgi:ABC-type lipoprotein release transport system permease subunit
MKALQVGSMVWNEVRHRPLNFVIPLLAIVVGVAYAVSSMLLMQSHQRRSAERVAALDDEIRKITLGMGFNINILPDEQNLSDFHASDFAEKTMPYEFVQRLANSPAIQSVRHLRPALIRKMDWPEHKRQVIVMGVTGVVPLSHASNPGKPLAEAVPQGTMNLGALLARELDLKPGQETMFHGRALKVNTIYPARGSKDDITLWTDLALVQELTGLPDQINLIQALECNCEAIDRLAQIQQEVSQVLGTKVQVIELATQAIARAQARVQVQAAGEQALASMQQRMSLLLGLLTAAGTTLVGMMALMNVRERKSEVGILRALGSSTTTILGLFLTKALLLGVLGAVLGILLGALIAQWVEGAEAAPSGGWLASLPSSTWSTILFLTPLFAVLASWVPATLAARQDPASVLGMDS